MTLADQLLHDMQEAMKARDVTRRETLRMARTAIKNAEVEVGHTLSDAEVLEVLQREAKRRRESIAEFQKGGRADLVAAEEAELAILETYLPQLMDRAEVEAAAREAIAELGVTSKAQMGLVMRRLMSDLKGRADGKLVNQVVQELLN